MTDNHCSVDFIDVYFREYTPYTFGNKNMTAIIDRSSSYLSPRILSGYEEERRSVLFSGHLHECFAFCVSTEFLLCTYKQKIHDKYQTFYSTIFFCTLTQHDWQLLNNSQTLVKLLFWTMSCPVYGFFFSS